MSKTRTIKPDTIDYHPNIKDPITNHILCKNETIMILEIVSCMRIGWTLNQYNNAEIRQFEWKKQKQNTNMKGKNSQQQIITEINLSIMQ